LLVAIAILAALLLPALGRAKVKAKQIQCLKNGRRMGLGSLMFAVDDARRPLPVHIRMMRSTACIQITCPRSEHSFVPPPRMRRG